MKAIIADTSCLVIYDRINQFDVLKRTFSELIVTPQVAEEFGDLPDWIKIQGVTNDIQYLQLIERLGKGEASAISLALELENSLLIIDERKGRKIAEELNIEIMGSLGVLIKAKERGIIQSVKEILNEIDQTDFRISASVRQAVLKVSGESD